MTPVARIGDHMRASGECRMGARYNSLTFHYILISISGICYSSSCVRYANSIADGKGMRTYFS